MNSRVRNVCSTHTRKYNPHAPTALFPVKVYPLPLRRMMNIPHSRYEGSAEEKSLFKLRFLDRLARSLIIMLTGLNIIFERFIAKKVRTAC